MSLLAGAAIVLFCWSALLALLLGWGLPLALTLSRSRQAVIVLRRALWLGLAVGSALILVLSLFIPLASPLASALLLGSGGVGGLFALRAWRQRQWRSGAPLRTPVVILGAALAVAQVVLAFAVLGPVTNYDTGLYHLGAISYGSDYGVIPGLANLYGPLGYATLEFAWGSALSGTPLMHEGFRLLNGLLMLVLALELVLRLLAGRRVGNYLLLVSVVAMWGPMLGMADFWIASPTQDAAALLLSLAMTAYFLDAVSGRSGWKTDAWVAVLIGIVLVAIRTTMIIYVALLVLALISIAIRRRYGMSRHMREPVVVGALAAVIGTTMLVRDYFFSGWLLYPLSVLPVDVPWRAENPQGLRDATLGFHRNPSDISGALDGWGWVSGWLARLPGYWETYLVGLLALMLVSTIIVGRHRGISPPVRRILISTAPAAGAVVAWFALSPPTFRFIWGPLVVLFAIPIAWMLWSLANKAEGARTWSVRDSRVLASAGAMIVVVAGLLTAAVRIPWDGYTQSVTFAGVVSYRLTPVPDAETSVEFLPSGVEMLRPVATDQCWAAYPLCSPNPSPTLQLRGDDLGAGFVR
mgnify:FL=1